MLFLQILMSTRRLRCGCSCFVHQGQEHEEKHDWCKENLGIGIPAQVEANSQAAPSARAIAIVGWFVKNGR